MSLLHNKEPIPFQFEVLKTSKEQIPSEIEKSTAASLSKPFEFKSLSGADIPETKPTEIFEYGSLTGQKKDPEDQRKVEYYMFEQINTGKKKPVKKEEEEEKEEEAIIEEAGFDMIIVEEPKLTQADIDELHAEAKELQLEAERIKKDAFEQYTEVIKTARAEGESIKETAKSAGYKAGYEEGYGQGRINAAAEFDRKFDEMREKLVGDVSETIKTLNAQKDEIIERQLESMNDLVISIAEKVIGISLKSSGEVIRKMLMSAVEKIRGRQWAKIYISESDNERMVESDIDILEAVSNISDHVKIVVMENKPAGTVIIELPDQIIDASVNTQMENIREILNN